MSDLPNSANQTSNINNTGVDTTNDINNIGVDTTNDINNIGIDTTNDIKVSASDSKSKKVTHRFEPDNRYFTIMCYGLLFVLGSILIYKFIGNFRSTLSAIGYIFSLLSPFLIGGFLALVLFPLVSWLNKTVFSGLLHLKSSKASKFLSILCTYIIVIGLTILLFAVVIPQIVTSITEITEQLPIWYSSALTYIDNFETNHPSLNETLNYDIVNERIEQALPEAISYITRTLSNIVPVVVTTSVAIVKGVVSFLIALIVSVYMISDHQEIFYHAKRLMYALLPVRAVDLTRETLKESANIFISFILGKALDSLIIGIICFFLMIIFRFPYAVLISVIVGITNMIPYFGPYFGGAIGFIFVLINNPIKALFFILLILVIQQFDGLYLGPKILGNTTGLSPLWVIFAITVGGSLFGVLGMFLGVPCVAVISYILNRIIKHLLNKKDITVERDDSQ